jgi:hypothetical protein
MIFPVMAQARSRSARTTCSNNLSQIGKALLIYMEDHDGGIPHGSNVLVSTKVRINETDWMNSTPGEPDYLWTVVGPYLKTRETLFCPRDPFAHKPAQWYYEIQDEWYVNHQFTSYRMYPTPLPYWRQDDFHNEYPGFKGTPLEKSDGSNIPFATDAEEARLEIGEGPSFKSDHSGVFLSVTYTGRLGTFDTSKAKNAVRG